MNSYFMGIDTGTQGVRIGICDENGNMITSHQKSWETTYPEIGWAEQKPLDWWDAILDTLKNCMNDLSEEEKQHIIACSVCSTSSTVFAIDKEGAPLMDAMMWMDARSKNEMIKINHSKHPVLNYCGQETSFEWMIPKALWIKHNRREVYDSCYRLVEQLDWINFKLCGILSSSICNTTCKWNYVRSLGGYQRDFFEEIGFEDYEEKIVTRVDKIGAVLGKIRTDLAETFGINKGMLVVQGGIDAHMAMFGLDVLRPGKLGIIMGTSFVHLCLSQDKPDISGVWGPYDSAVVDGLWLLEGGQISASGLVNWFRENFHIGNEGGNPYAMLEKSAADMPIGADGITVLDFFQGNRTPYKDAMAKGVIFGLNIKHTWKHVYRALIESVAFGTNNIIRNFETQGYQIHSITACGGVTRDNVWMQIISDVTGKKIIVNRDSQAGVLGCCVVAASGSGCYKDVDAAACGMVRPKSIIEPDLKNHEEYKIHFKRYLGLYENLKDMMHEQ